MRLPRPRSGAFKENDMNTQAPETQYYFDIVKETAADYVVRALNGSMHQLNKRVLRNADHNFKALLHPSTRIEEAPQELSGFISFFAEAALSFSFRTARLS